MEFGSKVLEVRGKLLISQEQLAKELSVSFSTVNRWEKGHHEPSFLARRKFDEFCKNHNIKFEE